jgi:hypothetical protein
MAVQYSWEEMLDRQVERGDLQAAVLSACHIPVVDLERAAKLMILAAEQEMPIYPAMARRWLVRFLREEEPKLKDIVKVADMLNEMQTFIERPEAKEYLLDLGKQVRERRRKGWRPER